MTTSKVHFTPHGRSATVRNGMTILAAARAAKVPIASKCGGRGACTSCKVQVRSVKPLSALSRMERHMLSDQMVEDGYRLGCQCKLTGDAEVILPEDPLKRAIRLQLEAARREREDS